MCVVGKGRLSQFCSGRTGKTFALLSALFLCSVSGKRECSNLHRFACWLMLCLWKRCAWCEVNSCASQYHCIPLFLVSSLFVLISLFLNWWGQRSFVGRRWRWCHCLQICASQKNDNLTSGRGEWGHTPLSGNQPLSSGYAPRRGVVLWPRTFSFFPWMNAPLSALEWPLQTFCLFSAFIHVILFVR